MTSPAVLRVILVRWSSGASVTMFSMSSMTCLTWLSITLTGLIAMSVKASSGAASASSSPRCAATSVSAHMGGTSAPNWSTSFSMLSSEMSFAAARIALLDTSPSASASACWKSAASSAKCCASSCPTVSASCESR